VRSRLPDPAPGRRPLRAPARRPLGVLLAASLLLQAIPGCSLFGGSGTPAPGQPGAVTGFLGGVVADEPRAALVGREVLSAGGNAADAAVALGFALAVTLPSRAGIGAGGACLAYAPGSDSPNHGEPEAVLFTPLPGAPGGDRPAAVPMLPRGLFALHARYGKLPFENLLVPAETLARTGFRASRALVRDLQVVARPLLADPNARAVFAPGGKPLEESQLVVAPELGVTLAGLRTAGVGDLYLGLLARTLEAGSRSIGGPLTAEQLRPALARLALPITLPLEPDQAAFLPPPADGGAAAAAALRVLEHDPDATTLAQRRALAVATRLRTQGGDPEAVIGADLPPGSPGPYPASTTFATLDRQGNAVVCALTMDNLFGTGRMVPGLGFLLAASPSRLPAPLLAAGLVWNPVQGAFRAAAGGAGQEGAPLAVAFALLTSIRAGKPLPIPVPEPGRANVILCSGYLPGDQKTCAWATDTRGAGLAVGGDN
jgi:gamma-glutamyltranspeptidase/glutathione hydrolase